MLNGRRFDSENELLDYIINVDEKAFAFLSDWFNQEHYISVQTSGSTGEPKQIPLKKEYMINSALATGAYFKLPKKTTTLLCLSTDYIAGKMMLVRALVLGWHLDIIEPSSHPLQKTEKTYDFSAMVPLQVGNSIGDLFRIKKLIVGGGVVSKQLQQKIIDIPSAIYATYGMTETITHIAAKKLNKFTIIDNETGQSVFHNENYRVLPNINISKDSRDCLVIDAPKISDERVVTNDVVSLLSENEFEWLGRYDTIINSGGIKLIPEQIEQKLASIIDDRFFVSALPDERLGEKLILVIEAQFVDKDIIREKVKNLTTLSTFERPKEMYVLNSFIETETKKINRLKTIEKLFKS